MTANPAILSEFDFIVVADASGSMGEDDTPNKTSRWEYMQESVTALVRDITKIDSDGIGLVIFGGSTVSTFDGVGVDKLKEAFATRRPMGGTPPSRRVKSGSGSRWKVR